MVDSCFCFEEFQVLKTAKIWRHSIFTFLNFVQIRYSILPVTDRYFTLKPIIMFDVSLRPTGTMCYLCLRWLFMYR